MSEATEKKPLSFLLDDPITDAKNKELGNTGLHRIAEKLFKMSQAIPCESIPKSVFKKGYWNSDCSSEHPPKQEERRYSKYLSNTVKLRGSFTCSISGEWGSGKTSLLNLIYEKFNTTDFEEKNKCVTVWFEPWRYESEKHLLIPLLIELNAQIVDSIKHEHYKQAALSTGKKLIGRFAKGLLKTASGIVEKQTGINAYEIGENFVKEYGELDQDWSGMQSELEKFKADFRDLIALGASSAFKNRTRTSESIMQDSQKAEEVPPIIIFIDDLDRCDTAQVRRLIEAIKLFLNERGVYFFLALDKHQVLRAIAKGFSSDKVEDHDLYRAKLYLEKFFQLNIALDEKSLPYQRDKEEFARKVLNELDLDRLLKKIVFDEKAKLVQEGLISILKKSIEVGFKHIKPNPRAVKKAARWLYYQIACPSDKSNYSEHDIYSLSFNFLEYVIENNWPDLWIESLSKVYLKARARLYRDFRTIVNEVLSNKKKRFLMGAMKNLRGCPS